MSFLETFFFNSGVTIFLLILSGLISLFFFFNSADFFVKMNINNPRLAISREKVAIQLGPAFLFLILAWINGLLNSSVDITALHYLSATFFLIAVVWRYFGFTGIFLPINDPILLDPLTAEKEVGDYLQNDLIIGLVHKDEIRAYPIVPLQITHVVNDMINDFYFSVTFCGLCNLGIAFNRNINGHPRNLRAVYAGKSNLVMTDDNGNYWQQLTGKGVYGKFARENPLEIVDTLTTTWKSWYDKYPSTVVLGNRLQGRVKFGYSWFKNLLHLVRETDTVLFPAGKKDDRYGPKEKLLGVIVNNNQMAIPIDLFHKNVELNTELNKTPLFVFFDHETQMYGAFEKTIDVNLILSKENNEILISSTDGVDTWELDGTKINAQDNLFPVKKMYPAFWFVWIGHYPESIIITP